ncbi:MAG TPA: serine/threonine-protein kinase [Acidimicrobiales bacterium]|nr:serine/threonine-protein kinase [Acidimicrobiales bacterium]
MRARLLGGRYRLGPRLGRGGMAEVYEGHDERLDRAVAVKVLRPEMAADTGVRERFEAEARSAARLSHPNVVAVFDTGEDEGTPYLVMERLPGETLADRMAAGPVDQAWLRRVAGDVLGALGAAHAAGLVHRDVKPGNILLAADGSAKVADFGIAKSLELAGDLTGTGLLVGTPAYLAPERLEGRPATERSDLYALGVVLYEALAGTKPFVADTPVAMAQAVLHDVPPRLVDLRPDVEPDLAAAAERSMARDPSSRPASAREMARLLAGDDPAGDDPAGDDTVALVPTASPDPSGAGGPGDATLVGDPGFAAPPPAPARQVGAGRRPFAPRRLAVLAVLLLGVFLVVALAAGRGSDDASAGDAVVTALRDLAGRVRTGDGPMGPEAGDRLEKVADQVEAGGGAGEANALLRDAAQWRAEGRLSDAAFRAMSALLGRIDGVDPSQATTTTAATTTTTTTTTTAPPPATDDDDGGGGDDDDDRGKKKGRGRD